MGTPSVRVSINYDTLVFLQGQALNDINLGKIYTSDLRQPYGNKTNKKGDCLFSKCVNGLRYLTHLPY